MTRRWTTLITALITAICFLGLLAPLSAQDFEFEAQDTTILYDVPSGVGSGQVELTNFQVTGAPLINVQGWSLGVAHDPSVVTGVDLEMGEYIQSLNGGTGPGFFSPGIHAGGITAGCVYSLIGGTICTYEVPKQILVITYDTVPGALAGNDTGDSTQLDFSASLGTPPVATVIVIAGLSVLVNENSGTITLVPDVTNFARGDANGDNFVDVLADAIVALDYMFAGGPTVPCVDALDVNDDGQANVADPVNLLTYGFGGSPTPPAPFPGCGADPTDDVLTCDSPSCP